MDSGLEKAVSLYLQCDHECAQCKLNQPVDEHSEHPTYCDMLVRIDNNFNGD